MSVNLDDECPENFGGRHTLCGCVGSREKKDYHCEWCCETIEDSQSLRDKLLEEA